MAASRLHIGYRMLVILIGWAMFLSSFALTATDKIGIAGVKAGPMSGFEAFTRSTLQLTHPLRWKLFIDKPVLVVVFVVFLAMLVMAFAPIFDAKTDSRWKVLGPVFIAVGVINYTILAQYLLGEVYGGFHLWSLSFLVMGVAFLIPEDRGWSVRLGKAQDAPEEAN